MPRKRNANSKDKSKVTAKPKGLGDSVAQITKATGIDKVVKKVFPDCGCQERKEWLNKTFPYVNKQKACMNEEQYLHFKGFKEKYLSSSLQPSIPGKEMVKLIDLYNSIFQVDVQGCSDCNAGHFVKKLDSVYLTYEKSRKTA